MSKEEYIKSDVRIKEADPYEDLGEKTLLKIHKHLLR